MSCSSSGNTCQALVKSGTPQTTPLPFITLPSGLLGSDPLVIATLRLNTSKYKDPCIKLDFVTNFNVFGITAGTIKFQVYKQCDNQESPIPIGAPWTFGPIAIGYEPLSFFVFDCDSAGCFNNASFTYTVVVTAAEFIVAELGYASFTNSTLAATITCDES